MAEPSVTMEVGNDGVALITMSNPPVNALARSSESENHSLYLYFAFCFCFYFCLFWIFVSGYAVFPALKSKFEEAMRRNDVKAVVLTGMYQSPADWFEQNSFN